jgi:WD40 repeat protein
VKRLRQLSFYVFDVKWSFDNKLIYSSDKKNIKIWNVNTQKCLKTMQGHTNNITAVQIKIRHIENQSDLKHIKFKFVSCTAGYQLTTSFQLKIAWINRSIEPDCTPI